MERTIKFINSHLESVVGELFSLNGLDPEKAKEGKFNFHRDILASDLALEGIIDAVLIKDLEYHIIKNETQSEFYISDHPVFTYNWFYKDLKHDGVTSIAATGFQIFLPLSPKIIVCLYDPKVYKYGHKNLVSSVYNNSDIEILNSFQIMNADSILGFRSKESASDLERLYKKYKNIELHQYESGMLSSDRQSKAKIKSTHYVVTRQAELKKMPSFIKIKKKSKSLISSYQERDPNFCTKHLEMKRLMKEQEERSVIEIN